MKTVTKQVDVGINAILGPRGAFIDFPAISRAKFPAVRNIDGGGAVLVDCQVVRRRKQELQSLSPADLKRLIGERALDESSIEMPLCDLVDLPPNSASALNVTAETKPPKHPGGRKQLPFEKQRFFQIGRSVEEHIPKCEVGIKTLSGLQKDFFFDPNAITSLLVGKGFNTSEIKAVRISKTPAAAAKRLVAEYGSLSNSKPLSLATVSSCYSRYLKVKNVRRAGPNLRKSSNSQF